MGYYCKIVEPRLTRPNPGVIMEHFQIFDDVTHEPVSNVMTNGFNVIVHNEDGSVKAENANQKKQRMAAEFNAYAAREIAQIEMIDANFDALLVLATDYRYPAVG